MAITYVNGNTGTATATSLTFSTDCTGANILLVGFSLSSGIVSSVTYNGVSLTLATSNILGIQTYLYYLLNPSSGTNDVVITASGSVTINGASVCYSGAKQTGQPDAVANDEDSIIDDISQSVTTVADNCVVVAVGATQTGTTLTRISSGTTRQNANKVIIIESGIKTPAGAVASTFSSNYPLDVLALAIMSISPDTGSTQNSNMLAFFI